MFCKNCGRQCADTDNVCSQCGTQLKPRSVAPKTTNALGFDLKPYLRFITLGITVLALIISIVNLFGLYDVNFTYSYRGFVDTRSYSVSYLYEFSSMLQVANVLYGVILLAVAGVAALYSLKELIGLPFYDQFIGKLPFVGNMPLALTGAASAVGGILQFILYRTADLHSWELLPSWCFGMAVTTSVSVNWTTWVMVILGVALVAVDLFVVNNVLNKKIAK